MNKIIIKKISPRLFKLRGFDQGSFNNCYNCPCGEDKKGDDCCRRGIFVDKETYGLMHKYKKLIEKKIKIPLENCFVKEWKHDPEFLGGDGIATAINPKTDFCMFHNGKRKGCKLIALVFKHKLPIRTIPSACRLYPIDWNKGRMFVKKNIRKGCYCRQKKGPKDKSILETHRKEINDIFKLPKNIKL